MSLCIYSFSFTALSFDVFINSHAPLKEILLLGLKVLIKASFGVVNSGVAAQLLRLEAEPGFTCTEVCVVAQWLLGRLQAHVTGGHFGH